MNHFSFLILDEKEEEEEEERGEKKREKRKSFPRFATFVEQ